MSPAGGALGRALCRSLWGIPLVFLLMQCGAVAANLNGPFVDEAVNATIGLQILRHVPGNYGWIGGSAYLYPVLAGAGYALLGLAGARLLTAGLYTLTLWLFAHFVARLFGRSAAVCATGLLAVNGIFFSIAHLAVYDALAMAGVTGAAWAVVESARTRRLLPTVVAGLCGALAILAKYPTLVALLPLPVLALVAGRRRPRLGHVVLSVLLAALAVVAYMLLVHRFVVPRVAMEQVLEEPPLFDRATLAYQAVYALGFPLAAASGGARRVLRKRPGLAALLLVGSVPWAVLHVATERYQSLAKDSAYGFLLVYPLAGLTLVGLARHSSRAALSLAGGGLLWGSLQWYWQDHSWGDLRPVIGFVLPELRPTDRVVLEHGWDFSMYAVLGHRLPSTASVIDRYRFEHGEDVCDADWIIGTRRAPFDVSDPLVRAAENCGLSSVRSFPFEFYSPLPPLVQHQAWRYEVFRRVHP